MQLKNSIAGFFILGTYGEGLSLHPEKRKRLAEIVAEHVGSKAIIINSVSSTSLEVSLELARHSLDIGITNISLLPPLYYRAGPQEIAKHYQAFDRFDINILIYNNPSRVGVDINPSTLRNIESIAGNVVGIKDSTGSPDRIVELVTEFGEELHIAAASDSLLPEAFLYGADTHICGICNALPEVGRLLYTSIMSNDIQKAFRYKKLLIMIRSLARDLQVEGVSIVKAILNIRGLRVGDPVRPGRKLCEEDMRRLKGVLEYIATEINIR